jgi:hypothetical protein
VGTQVASPPCTDTCQGNNRTHTVICGRRPCLIAHQIVLASRAAVLCKQRTTQASDLFLQLRHRLLQFFNFVTHTEKSGCILVCKYEQLALLRCAPKIFDSHNLQQLHVTCLVSFGIFMQKWCCHSVSANRVLHRPRPSNCEFEEEAGSYGRCEF